MGLEKIYSIILALDMVFNFIIMMIKSLSKIFSFRGGMGLLFCQPVPKG